METTISAKFTRTEHPDQSDFEMHIHNDCEIFYFISGNANYSVEGSIYSLHKGDIIFARNSESHHIIFNSDAAYERFVVNFPISLTEKFDTQRKVYSMFYERPLGKYNHFRASVFSENMWQYYLQKICESQSEEKKLIYLLPLLTELSEEFELVKAIPENVTIDKSAEIIQYIDSHLFEDISLDKICRRFFISKTHLNRVFKVNTGSTVWNYISAKRLLFARGLLKSGERPTKIYERCGFCDYVSFYKAYKKKFGISPQKEQRL